MFNLPLVSPPLSEAANEAEVYDMPFIARSLAEVMDEVGRCVLASETLYEPSREFDLIDSCHCGPAVVESVTPTSQVTGDWRFESRFKRFIFLLLSSSVAESASVIASEIW